MIYLLHGEDTDKARAKAHELVDTLRAKKPDASFFRIEASQQPIQLDELVGSQGLFEKKYIVLFDRVFENKETKEQMLEKRKELAESPHIFIFLEGKIDKASLTKLEKVAAKVQEFAAVSAAPKFGAAGKFNIFAMSDALGTRDKKQLWFLYQKAVMNGLVAEEIHGTLFWAVKSMLLAVNSKTAGESGLNPFVYQKSVGFARNFSQDELAKMSGALVRMYHDAHRGEVDFDGALERWVLSAI